MSVHDFEKGRLAAREWIARGRPVDRPCNPHTFLTKKATDWYFGFRAELDGG